MVDGLEVLRKINFVTWETAWGRILTLDMLQRMGVPLVKRFFCVNSVRSRQIIFYSLVVLQEFFGSYFFLPCSIICRAPCGRCFWVGKALLLAREERNFGKQLVLACFGQGKRLEIELCLKIIFCLYKN